MKALSSYVAIVVTLVTAAAASAEEAFAKETIGKFELEAATEVDLKGGEPYIQTTRCWASGEDITFSVDREGRIEWLNLRFHDEPDEDGNRQSPALLGDGIWLYIDGRRFEFRNISTPSRRFSDFKYRPGPDPNPIILPVWRGYQAVRESETDPFMHLSRIYGQIIAASELEWGFKSRDWSVVDRSEPSNQLPDGWEGRRYPIEKDRLAEALEWCARQVTSDAATRLPPNYSR